jgi:predicted RNase H-like nuclease
VRRYPTIFIGVDLAWKCDPVPDSITAICVCDAQGVVSSPFTVRSDAEIMGCIPSTRDCWLAIDAPLHVPNHFGMRQAERDVARAGIRILPSNRDFLTRKCGGIRGERLAVELVRNGFQGYAQGVQGSGLIFEAYPFGIIHGITHGKVPRYKHGPLDVRRSACLQVLRAVEEWEPTLRSLDMLANEIDEAEPGRMREMGDRIDSMLCATCLYAHWLYDGKRTRLFGDGSDGHILLV